MNLCNKTAGNIGFAARLAGRWSNGHFIDVVLHLGRTFNLGLLFVNLYFYIFIQQRFRAKQSMNSYLRKYSCDASKFNKNSFMTFKYFDKPEIFTGLRGSPTVCDICGQEKLCFDAEAFLGSENIASICPECLASGQLQQRDIFTCEGDIAELKRQLKNLHPSLTELEIDDIAKQKTIELEKTTPYLVTWQDWRWPCADGDYCQFIGYGSRPFYEALATTSTGEALFKYSFYYNLKDDSDIDYLWQDILPKEEVKDYHDSKALATLFYVFKSLHSDTIITIWDCH